MTPGDEQDEAVIALRIKPRASTTRIIGKTKSKLGAAVSIEIAAPPVSGRANKELLRFLSKTLGVSPNDLTIISGHSARDKLVRIRGLSQDRVFSLLFAEKR